MARERKARLILLYIVDAEFLGYATVARPSVILRELRRTGEFMMDILQKRINRQGVEEVNAIVRTGGVRRQIIESLRWQDANVLVIGHPVKSPGTNTFTPKSLKNFLDNVRSKTGVEVVVVGAPNEDDAGS